MNVPESTNVTLIPYSLTSSLLDVRVLCCLLFKPHYIRHFYSKKIDIIEIRPMMALSNLIARLLSLAAFILALIVIFAGTQSGDALGGVYMVLVSDIISQRGHR